jgi:hypothetical protein
VHDRTGAEWEENIMRARTGLLAIGGAIVLAVGGGTAYAAIAGGPVDSSGVVHGCYTNRALNGSHVFVLQDAGTTCPKGTTAISWNQAGATGPAGPAGPIGPAGATGATGLTGATGAAGPQGPTGLTGATGAAGTNGTNGNTVLNGTGSPTDNSLGNNGDFYIDTAEDVLYGPKAGGTWPGTGTSLVGPAGTAGSTGPAGPAGPQGAPGPAGPAGPAGSGTATAGGSGLDVTIVSGTDTTYTDAAASCPSAEPYVIGGGGSYISPTGSPEDVNNQPVVTSDPTTDPESWEVIATGDGGVLLSGYATAYAICSQ